MNLIEEFTKRPLMKSYMVYQYLKEELKNGRWKFGEKIPINDISNQFSISRRPVLDAMKMLENDRFVEIIPQSGCKVVDYTKQEIYDHFLVSSIHEGLAAELASIHHTDEEIKKLNLFTICIKDKFTGFNNKEEYFRYNREWHFQLLAMTRSSQLISHTIPLWDLNDFFIVNIFGQYNVFIPDSFDYHDRIISAVKQRDSQKARRLMEEHTRTFVNQLLENLGRA